MKLSLVSSLQTIRRIASASRSSIDIYKNIKFENFSTTSYSDKNKELSPTNEVEQSIEEMIAKIDTTLTPEQKIYVETLKKKMKGGNPKKRSPYRDVPLIEELKHDSPFPPLIPPNAQELIDYALSFVPKRAGPRRSRHNKRMAHRFAFKNAQDVEKKKQMAAALLRKQAKLKRQRDLIKKFKEEARMLGYAPKLQRKVKQA